MDKVLKQCPLPRCGHPAKLHKRMNRVSCSYCSPFHGLMSIEDWQSIPRIDDAAYEDYLCEIRPTVEGTGVFVIEEYDCKECDDSGFVWGSGNDYNSRYLCPKCNIKD